MKTVDRGSFVVLVGPDGVGKTSVAAELASRTQARYFHFRPPINRRWTNPLPGELGPTSPPSRSGNAVSMARLAKTLITFWLGYLVSVLPETRSGKTVIADRWAYGYLVRPANLGYSGPRRFAMWLIHALPQPDCVFALVAEPGVITARKPELNSQQAADEVRAWASLPIQQLSRLDANEPLDDVVDELMRRLDEGAGCRPSSDNGPQGML